MFPSVTPLPTIRTNPDLEHRRSIHSATTPSRPGSTISSFSSTSFHQQQSSSFDLPLLPQHNTALPTATTATRNTSRLSRIRRWRIIKYLIMAYHWVIDVILLIVVCFMGLFYDVEVSIVKPGDHRHNDGTATTTTSTRTNSYSSTTGGGRVILQRERIATPPRTAPQDESHHYTTSSSNTTHRGWATASAMDAPRSTDNFIPVLGGGINSGSSGAEMNRSNHSYDYLTQQHTPLRDRRWDPV